MPHPTQTLREIRKACELGVEYNGECWLGVHPLVQDLLDEDPAL